jgi:monoamine oxidase
MERAQVVIVGAGLSGMAAARRLRAAGVEGVAVLDGAARPGGRAAVMPPSDVEGVTPGGMFVQRTDRTLLGLAGELGVPVDRVEHDTTVDDLRVDESGETEVSDDNVPLDVSWWTRLRSDWLFGRLARLAARIDFAEPWRSPDAEELDSQTVRAWLRDRSSDRELLTLVEEFLTLEAGFPADRISMLWLLAHIGPDPEEEIDPLRISPGGLVDALAAEVGDLVRADHHVSRIEQDDREVRVSGEWGVIAADRVVLALSPADCRRIEISPEPPPSRRRLEQQWPQAEIIRTEITYWRPFWRNFGLSGEAHFEDGVPAWTIDDSPPDSDRGRLIAHTYTFGAADPLGADQGVTDDPARHRSVLLDNLTHAFGPLAAEPLAVVQSAAGPGVYSRAYQSPTPPGFLTEHGPLLRAPVGRLHWAATETAAFPGNGTLDGALESGHRAAEEVRAALLDRVP